MQSTLPISLLLLLLPLNVFAETEVITGTDVTCSWSHNVAQNPSFELGSLSPWAVYQTQGTSSVVADASDDGGYVAALTPATSGWGSLYQSLTDLTVGQTYTLSFDYKIASAVNSGTCNFYFAVNGVFGTNRITTTPMGYVAYSGSSTTPAASSWRTLSTTYAPTSTNLDLMLFVICSGNSRLPQAMPQVYFDNVQFSNDNVEIETCTTSTYTSTVTIASTLTPVSTPSAVATSSIILSSAVVVSQTPSSKPDASLSSSVIVASSSTPSLVASTVPTSNTPSSTPSRTPAGPTGRPLPSSSRVPISSTSPPASPLKQSSTALPLSVSSLSSRNPASTGQLSQTFVLSSSATAVPQSTPLVNLPVPQSSSSNAASSIGVAPSAQITSVVSSSIASATEIDSSSSLVSVPAAPATIDSGATNASGSTPTTVSITENHISSSIIGPTTIIETQSSLPQTMTGGPLPGNEGSAPSPAFTTSTVFSTRTATITACPSSVLDCPASAKSTYVTTETIILSTTICPVTAAEPTVTAAPKITESTGAEDLAYTASTVFSTRTATITACPSSVLECPASSKTTSVMTETILVSITICPVTPTATAALSVGPGNNVVEGDVTTETLLTTVTKTITACPSTVTDCPASQKQTYTTTEILVAGTTAYPVASAKQISVAGNSDVLTTTLSLVPVGNGNSKPTETGTTPMVAPTPYSSELTFVNAEPTSFEISASTPTASTSSTSVSSVAIDVSAQAIESESSEAGIYASALPTTSTVIHASASNPTHSFSALISTAASSSTLTSQKSSATSSSTSTQSYSGITAAPSVAYTGSASPLRSEWLKVIGGIFLVLFV
ncbi:hypothetical protein N7517_003767 [Penicillium concentricum]|uniref:CBM-cenC domain-containing protein n=1 Tax=Penicillium concentricum TaxID=293559 RepID=A0A9W9S4A8_9EURO|nr:uncharacterized protein N7517_003767 [Penicillium concentricum]KAJ5371761.1 hypothetical protein N7517_003767 [Penicillium concentricum]